MKKVMCIECFGNFKVGEEYIATKVNENWFLVDSIGVANDDFHLHFEIQEEIVSRNSGSHKETNDKRFIEEEQMFKQILESFGYYDMIEDKNEKETWWDKLINYIFV
jgi:hypothetical protein